MLFTLMLILAVAIGVQLLFATATRQKVQFTQFNACGLLPLRGSDDDCVDSFGGLVKTWVADIRDLDLANAEIDEDGRVVDIPWLIVNSPYVDLIPDSNDQSFFNQEGSRDDNGKYSAAGTANYTFAGVNESKYAAAEKLIECCAIVAIHEWSNGFATIQGLMVTKVNGVYSLKRTNKAAKAIPSVLSDTSAEGAGDKITMTIVSTASKLAARLSPGYPAVVTPPAAAIPATTIDDLVAA